MGLTRLGFGTVLLMIMKLIVPLNGQTYEDALRIFADKLDTSSYNPNVRPLVNQMDTMFVGVLFNILSIVEVDDVGQKFVCNGFIYFFWVDELLRWNPEDYGNQTIFNPDANTIWKPRTLLMNTLGKRDVFSNDGAFTVVFYNGSTIWAPGSVFSTSCKLDLTKFPFDEQICSIELASAQYVSIELQFFPISPEGDRTFYTEHGEWELLSVTVSTENLNVLVQQVPMVEITVHLKRRSTFFLINIVLPAVLLSFLNVLVFIVPIESGEKLSYGVTVQLALAVFTSIVCEMLPKTSESIPSCLIYMFTIFIVSLLSVIDTIVIMCLHHKKENTKKGVKPQSHFNKKVAPLQCETNLYHVAQSRATSGEKATSGIDGEYPEATCSTVSEKGKYKALTNWLNVASFFVFMTVWLALTLGFLLDIAFGVQVV